jgi:cytochrome c peroxidase
VNRNWVGWASLGLWGILLMGMAALTASPWRIWVPEGFAVPDQPADNVADSLRVALGKRLFFDPVLSRDSSISCGSCHLPEFAFADTLAVSPGVEGRLGFRNAPSLANVGYVPRLLRDGTIKSLEMQVIVPLQEHAEMDLPLPLAAARVARDPAYAHMSLQAYGRVPDPWVVQRALSAYQRTLISGEAPLDRQLTGGVSGAMSPLAEAGRLLFNDPRTGCQGCHAGMLLTDHSLRNNGLHSTAVDSGRARISTLPEDKGMFRVPSLRNVGLTAPYMHDGRFKTLEEVVAHYDRGGDQVLGQDPRIRPLHLSAQEKAALVAFLGTGLTDINFVRRHSRHKDGHAHE